MGDYIITNHCGSKVQRDRLTTTVYKEAEDIVISEQKGENDDSKGI